MGAKEIQDFSNKYVSGTEERVYANVGNDSLKKIG